MLRAVAIGSVAFAFGFLAIVAASDWTSRVSSYETLAVRTARAAEEHALKMLELNEALNQQVIASISEFDDDADIERNEAVINQRLKAMATRMPSVASIFISGSDGVLLASSAAFPVPHISIANQDYFIGARNGDPLQRVSRVFVGLVTHERVFNTTMKRTHRDGSFAGVVSIALRLGYFDDFYRETVGIEPHWRIDLTRADGEILARYPAAARKDASTDPQILDMVKLGSPGGLFRSSGGAGSGQTLLAFSKVDGYPVFVTASFPLDAIRAAWLRYVGLLAACLLIPCLMLWSVIALSLNRLTRSERDWEALQAEMAVRKVVEEAYRESRKMESLGHLVGSVAHDFNNLLMVVSANIQVARLSGGSKYDAQIAAIERAVHEGQNLTRQLLGVARKQPLRAETIDLPAWFGERHERFAELLGAHVEIDVQIDDAAWPFHADPDELELALTNIALNARDAMPNGGTFRLRASNLEIGGPRTVSLNGEFVCLSLEDNGTGMSQDVLSRAFEPLFSTKTSGRGVGLGLAQVFAFCEQAGGLATLESKLGEGTTVRIYLQRETAPVIALERADDHDKREAVPLSVLLVEDDNDVAEANEALMMTLGHVVTRAASADEALAILDASPASKIDVVVSDIQMPGSMNGIDLADNLQDSRPQLPVLLVTGYARELERARSANRAVFSKPFDIQALDVTLRRIGARASA